MDLLEAGLAELVAALRADDRREITGRKPTPHDRGARVLLLESETKLGGSTAVSGGWFFAAGTSVQRAAGIVDDTPQSMFDYYAQVNQWRIDPPVVRRLCDEAGAATLGKFANRGQLMCPTVGHSVAMMLQPRDNASISTVGRPACA